MPTTLTLRLVKGSPLTNAEVDGNFTSIRDEKIERDGTIPMTGKLTLVAPTTARANIRISEGAADPTSPAIGDIWNNTGVLKFRKTGVNTYNIITSEAGQAFAGGVNVAGSLGIGTTTPATPLDVNGATTMRGHLTFSADGTYDIGASGALRPRTIYTSGDITIGVIRAGVGPGADYRNTVFGYFAMGSNTTGIGLTSIGYAASIRNTTGNNNTAVGTQTLFETTTGSNNTGVGMLALTSNVTGGNNTAVGSNALRFSTADNNTTIGSSSLTANTTGYSNTAAGSTTLTSNTTGFNNTGVGTQALGANTTGDSNAAFGVQALLTNTSGSHNTATGVSALRLNTTGTYNVGTGTQALRSNTTGINNTATGTDALRASTTGNNNSAHGFGALTANTTGSANVAVGYNAGSALTTGSNNTIIGGVAGTAGLADTVIIAAGTAERIRIDSSGNMGIGTTTPATPLDLNGASTLRGTVNMLDNVLSRPRFTDYAETYTTPAITAGVLTLNIENGNVFRTTRDANITTLTVSNPAATGNACSFTLIFDANGTGYTIAWPTSFKWPGGTAPTITTTSGRSDMFVFYTNNGGTTWYAMTASQNFVTA